MKTSRDTSIATHVYARIAADSTTVATRPNLTDSGGLAELEATFAARAPLYQEACHAAVDTDDRSPAEVVSAILQAWTSWPTSR